jgi:hypothetical protein
VLYEGVIVWSRRSNCSSPCACDYPTTGPSFVGETITGSCTCGCGHCAYVRVLEGPWMQMSGCADWQDCTCPSAPANFYDYSIGQMVIASCS